MAAYGRPSLETTFHWPERERLPCGAIPDLARRKTQCPPPAAPCSQRILGQLWLQSDSEIPSTTPSPRPQAFSLPLSHSHITTSIHLFPLVPSRALSLPEVILCPCHLFLDFPLANSYLTCFTARDRNQSITSSKLATNCVSSRHRHIPPPFHTDSELFETSGADLSTLLLLEYATWSKSQGCVVDWTTYTVHLNSQTV